MNLASLSAPELATLFDVSEKTVRNWMNNNGLPFETVGTKRKIVWLPALKWYVDYSGNSGGNAGSSVKISALPDAVGPSESYEDALARKTRAEADLKELQLAEKRGEVASILDVEKVLAASTVATRTQIEALPSLLATQLVGVPDQNTVFRIVGQETKQLLSNLATIDAVREASTRDKAVDD